MKLEPNPDGSTASGHVKFYGARDLRFDCRISAKLIFKGIEIPVTIVNISASGVALHKTAIVELPIGQSVSITSFELGTLYGTLKWASGGRFGVELIPKSASSPKYEAFIKPLIENHEH
jgi:PilZ domain